MSNKNEPAYPYILEKEHYANGAPKTVQLHAGLTKRELFAAMAMQGIVGSDGNFICWDKASGLSVAYADALIKELSK